MLELDYFGIDGAVGGNQDWFSNVVMHIGGCAAAAACDTCIYFGKRFGNSGGVAAAVQESLKESGNDIDVKVYKANGAAECKKALLLMKVGRLPEDFIEGMACDGGCVGGPSSFKDQMLAKKSRDALIKEADDRGIYKNLSNYDEGYFSMHR